MSHDFVLADEPSIAFSAKTPVGWRHGRWSNESKAEDSFEIHIWRCQKCGQAAYRKEKEPPDPDLKGYLDVQYKGIVHLMGDFPGPHGFSCEELARMNENV